MGYAMRQADGAEYVYVAQAEGGTTLASPPRRTCPAAPGAADPLLTLDRLRRLLLGEFTEPPSPADAATDELCRALRPRSRRRLEPCPLSTPPPPTSP